VNDGSGEKIVGRTGSVRRTPPSRRLHPDRAYGMSIQRQPATWRHVSYSVPLTEPPDQAAEIRKPSDGVLLPLLVRHVGDGRVRHCLDGAVNDF
jgi:hypothetical protein